MGSGGDEGQHRGEQGIDAWAKHGVEEYDERDAVDRAERGLAGGDRDPGSIGEAVVAGDTEHDGNGAGGDLPVDPPAETGTVVGS